jgi:hypothetical protein
MTSSGIGELNEQPLHAALKAWYARPGDQLEVVVDGYVVDVVRDDLLIEIQTGNFSSIKGKLADLVARYSVRLVYPIAYEKWLLKRPRAGEGPRTRRKSPKRGSVLEVFEELVSFPELLCASNFSLDVVLTQEEELRYHDATRWRRHGWVVEERRLLDVVERHRFSTPTELRRLLPAELPDPFTTQDLAEALGRSRRLAQKMAYCLRKTKILTKVGQQGRAFLYCPSGRQG